MEVQISEINDLKNSIMQGRLDFFRSCSIYSPLTGAGYEATPEGRICYSSGIHFPVCNGVMEEDAIAPSEKEIREVVDYFQERGLPFIWWSSAKVECEGMVEGGTLTGIALDISEENYTTSDKAMIKEVRTKEDLELFSQISGQSFGMQSGVAAEFQAVSGAAMQKEEQKHFLAYVEDRSVGTVTLSTSPSSAGIWNLTVLQEYRKKGVGSALLIAALIEAQALNYDSVMAILMPKGMAWTIFEKMNFKSICQFPFYMCGANKENLEKIDVKRLS